MNLLFIFTDQQRPDTLGCYGNPLVETPHLDGLAASGALEGCEVPIALLVWRGGGLAPPDPWAVRRALDVAEADAAHGLATGATARRLGLAAMLRAFRMPPFAVGAYLAVAAAFFVYYFPLRGWP